MRLMIVLVVVGLIWGRTGIAQEPLPPKAGNLSEASAVDYVPIPEEVVAEMLRLAELDLNDLLYDLGSGDGRIAIAAARQYGARAVGVERNPRLVRESEQKARVAGVGGRVQFLSTDLFKTNLSEATTVTLYPLPEIRNLLRSQLFAQLKPGTSVVSHTFDLGNWQPDRKSRVSTHSRGEVYVYAWIIPANVSGTWQAATSDGAGPYLLKLEQSFQRVKGILVARGQTRTLTNVQLTGSILHFSVVPPGQQVAIRFEVQLNGDALEGTATAPGDFARSWKATRTERSTADWYF